jgi:hypothetical protein
MANTVWIIQIKNDSDMHIWWRDGENGKKGNLAPGDSFDYHGTGFCFPWVDHTKNELWKAIDFVNGETSTPLFSIFQSYNYDTIRWIKDDNDSANHAVDVAGDSAANGSKALFIRKDGSPVLVASKK